jgi:hypothetical protein
VARLSGPEEFKQIKELMGEHGWKPEQSTNAVLRVLPKYASSAEVLPRKRTRTRLDLS